MNEASKKVAECVSFSSICHEMETNEAGAEANTFFLHSF